MIRKETVEKLALEGIEGTDCFIVDITIAAGNQIRVLLDKDSGTSITDCIRVSRAIEHNLDREEEDFQLEVMSPGLDYPLKSVRQYKKNIGRGVTVRTKDDKVTEGDLTEVTESDIVVRTRIKERIEGRKAKHWVETDHRISYEDITETKIIISFK